jgi:hypothetical protein
MLHQDFSMRVIKRERWTEADVLSLPAGEHDYFERKSGMLVDDENNFIPKLARAISAFANSGGGHIVIGVNDVGRMDGISPTKGRTSMRDWLEQKIPNLVDFPLTDFRVHELEPSLPTTIPSGRQVIVIDVGDSPSAPHQCLRGKGDIKSYVYYMRQGGRSVPAPHFYVELLHQRLANPALIVDGVQIQPKQIVKVDESIFLVLSIAFRIANVGSVAAYKWAVSVRQTEAEGDRIADYVFERSAFPRGVSGESSITLDDTILPGLGRNHTWQFGCYLRPDEPVRKHILEDFAILFAEFRLTYVLATETSAGQTQAIDFGEIMNLEATADFVVTELSRTAAFTQG